MIVHLKTNTNWQLADSLAAQTQSIVLRQEGGPVVLITPSALKTLPAELEPHSEAFFPMDSDIQLASNQYVAERTVKVGNAVLGKNQGNTLMIGGPCSVESWEQISASAALMVSLGITTLRAGCYKPRTSPYSFQGLGYEGLLMLDKVREQFGLQIITEVKDSSHVHEVIAQADIVQIGAKAMYDHSILRACGKANKPVLLKRGFGSNLQEFVQAAEFILSGGNSQVMLCERGIRTFEQKTRFTLDLCGVAYLREYTNLPLVLDPSHAMGYRYGVPSLARACVAMGVEGLLIETHPNPQVAMSDASQQLNHQQFTEMYHSLKPIAAAVGRVLV